VALLRGRRWVLFVGVALIGPLLLLAGVIGYYYVTFSRDIDRRLHGELERTLPRVYARPLELARGQALGERELIDRLNDLGYAQRARLERPGEFIVVRDAVALIPRAGTAQGRTVRVTFARQAARAIARHRVDDLEVAGDDRPRVTLDAPLITALITTGREKRRKVPLATIPRRMVQAVLAIEDRRFYDHPGVDVIASVGAVFTNAFGDKPYLVGGSTLTQQLVKNLLLTREKTLKRKLKEQVMAVVVETRLSKDEILELYLNDVDLGQRGSFAIRGVAEAARLFFGKDIANLTLAEAATIAGVIQSPSRLSPFRHPQRARDRRNVVLQAMAEAEYISTDAAQRTAREPLAPMARALEAEAPYFVDLVAETLNQQYPRLLTTDRPVDVHTTLDLHLQRLAQESVREGLSRLDQQLSKRRRPRTAQAALVAIDPRTGEILTLVGGRSYNQSQYNRAISSRRQPGSVFKPFVYLAAFEQAVEEGRTDLTPATVVTDEPTTFAFDQQLYNPGNYGDEYDGPITLRRALAFSRNVATVKVAEAAGYDHVAALWRRIGIGTAPRPYPSIALGVFEATPHEIASAYTLFPNGGVVRPLHAIARVTSGNQELAKPKAPGARRVARADTTFLVTNMMRSVLNEGTGAGARSAGFTLDAAGKSGTTNDLRDAWFVGFTPELLTVVWVGLDDNQPLGLSGTQAALPIWTTFMSRALSGRANQVFSVPGGVTFVEIDRDTGQIAQPGCPRIIREAFLAGMEPTESCDLHRF
jgi:penicillin-binding protein 1B